MPKGMSDASHIAALWSIRARIVRDGLDGLSHVEALLRLQGCDPTAQVVPIKRPDNRFQRGELSRLIRHALKDGPRTLDGIAGYVAAQRPGVSRGTAYRRASSVLSRMVMRGELTHARPLWRLPD